jgi:hypothetical protein
MTPGDLIAGYLAQLRVSLRAAPAEAELILAEAEDHLRETAAAGMATGMTELEAQEAAISSFGPIGVVARAHQARRSRVAGMAGEIAMAAWKLASLLVLAYGVGGVAALTIFAGLYRSSSEIWIVENRYFLWLWWSVMVAIGVVLPTACLLAGRRRPSRRPLPARFLPVLAASVFAAAALAYGVSGLVTIPILTVTAFSPFGAWIIAANPAFLWLDWSVLVMIGAALLAGYRVARRRQRRGRRPEPLPAGLFPVLAASFFAAVTLALFMGDAGASVLFDPGLAIIAYPALAVGYAVRAGLMLVAARRGDGGMAGLMTSYHQKTVR